MEENELDIIAHRLQTVRRKNKLTQEAFGRMLGISKSTVSTYELGAAFPSCKILYNICTLFQVKADYLLGLENRPMIDVEGLSEEDQIIIERFVKRIREGKAQ